MLKKIIYLAVLVFSFSSHAANANIIDEDSSCPTAAIMAIVENKSLILENHLTYGLDPNASLEGCSNEFSDGFPKGSTLLHIAAYYRRAIYHTEQPSFYRILLNHGADPDAVNEAGYKPSDITTCLFNYGARACRDSMNISSPMSPGRDRYPFRLPVI